MSEGLNLAARVALKCYEFTTSKNETGSLSIDFSGVTGRVVNGVLFCPQKAVVV